MQKRMVHASCSYLGFLALPFLQENRGYHCLHPVRVILSLLCGRFLQGIHCLHLCLADPAVLGFHYFPADHRLLGLLSVLGHPVCQNHCYPADPWLLWVQGSQADHCFPDCHRIHAVQLHRILLQRRKTHSVGDCCTSSKHFNEWNKMAHIIYRHTIH